MNDELEEILGCRGRELSDGNVVDIKSEPSFDRDVLVASTIDGGSGQLFEKNVGFAVEDP